MGLLQKIELDNGLRSDWVIGAIALAIMFWIAPVLAAISAIGVTVMGIISVWAVIRDRWFTQQLQLKSAALNDFFMETIQGILTVKTAGLEGQRQGQFAALSRELFACLQRQKVYQQVKEGLYQLSGSLEMVAFMLVVLPMVHGKLISGRFLPIASCGKLYLLRHADLLRHHSENAAARDRHPRACPFCATGRRCARAANNNTAS
jgi:ATP-binding cassette subfamily B protein RaxB